MVSFLKHNLVSSLLLLTVTAKFIPGIPIDTRTLDEIYAAAQREYGPFHVMSGGDCKASCVIP